MFADFHVADQDGVRGDEGRRMDLRNFPAVLDEHGGSSAKASFEPV
jgi:hypothetical protein